MRWLTEHCRLNADSCRLRDGGHVNFFTSDGCGPCVSRQTFHVTASTHVVNIATWDSTLMTNNKLENLSSHIDMQTHASSTLDNRVTLTFDLRVNACQVTAMHCTSTMFVVDSSSHFPFRAQTQIDRQTDRQTHTHRVQLISLPCIGHRWHGNKRKLVPHNRCNTSQIETVQYA